MTTVNARTSYVGMRGFCRGRRFLAGRGRTPRGCRASVRCWRCCPTVRQEGGKALMLLRRSTAAAGSRLHRRAPERICGATAVVRAREREC
eukprot:361100-Chlamydomonas_euryale.AAC.12